MIGWSLCLAVVAGAPLCYDSARFHDLSTTPKIVPMLVNSQIITPSYDLTMTLAALLSQQVPWTAITDDWQALLDAADYHRVLGILMAQMPADTLPADLHARTKARIKQAAMIQLKQREHIHRVNRLLHAQDIPALWLKGAAIAPMLYETSELRIMTDIDVLVPYDQRRQALAILREAGYHMRQYMISDHTLSLDEIDDYTHHYELFRQELNIIVRVELHYDLFKRRAGHGDREELAWFWEHSTFYDDRIGTLRVMKPEPLLLYLAAHDILQHDMKDLGDTSYTGIRLLRKYDVYRLLQRHDIDWQMTYAKARRMNWVFALNESLRQVQTLFGITLPADARQLLQQHTIDPQALSDSQKKATIYLRSARQMTWRMRLRYLWHDVIFIERANMRRVYDLSPATPVFPYYIWRIVTKTLVLLQLLGRELRARLRRTTDKASDG
jgi:hypothetical protein